MNIKVFIFFLTLHPCRAIIKYSHTDNFLLFVNRVLAHFPYSVLFDFLSAVHMIYNGFSATLLCVCQHVTCPLRFTKSILPDHIGQMSFMVCRCCSSTAGPTHLIHVHSSEHRRVKPKIDINSSLFYPYFLILNFHC